MVSMWLDDFSAYLRDLFVRINFMFSSTRTSSEILDVGDFWLLNISDNVKVPIVKL